MPEYAGKQPSVTPLDYGNLTGGLIDILKETEARRNNERANLDQIYQAADATVQETEQFQNQNLQTLVHNSADQVRDLMYEWNKELKAGRLKPKDYQARIMQAQQGWSMFANSSKTFDETMKNGLSRQQGVDGKPAAGSGFEEYLYGVYAENADLNNTKLSADPESGKMFMSKYDTDGNIISTFDVSRMGNPGNMIDNRFNLSANIQSDVSMWEPFKIETGSGWQGFTTIEDVRQSPAYQYAVDAKVQSVLSNNRSTASVLVDNGVGEYGFYQNPEEKRLAMLNAAEQAQRVARATGENLSDDELLEIAKIKGEKMILVQYDKTGTMQPVITPDQRKAAEDRVKNEIEIQLGRDVAKTAGWKADSGENKDGDGDKKSDLLAGYKSTLNAFGFDPDSVISNPNNPKTWRSTQPNFSGLSPSFSYAKVGDVVKVLKQGTEITKDGEYELGKVVAIARTPKDLAHYAYGGSNVSNSSQLWEKSRKQQLSGGGSKETDPAYKGDVISQGGFEYKWNYKTKKYE